MLAAAGTSSPLANVDRTELIESLAGSLGLEHSRALTHGAERAIDQLEKNVNTRLLVEVLLLDWPVLH